MAAKRSPRLLVCADDLTGANDIGAQFAKRGIPAIVVIEPGTHDLPADFQVVVVNTESRHRPPQEAAERVRRWVELGRSRGLPYYYKKTDSTLRGNVGAELEALSRATGVRILPFTAALPELGRTTRAGIHYVHGQPLHQSSFAQDPLNPIRTSCVAEIVRAQCTLPVQHVGIPAALGPGHSGIVIFDAVSAEDIDQIGAELAGRDLLRVCAGPAGFGMQLAKRLEFSRSDATAIRCRGPALIINGSVNEVSLRQISQPQVPDGLPRLQMDREFLLASEEMLPRLLPAEAEAALASAPGDLLVYSVSNRDELPSFRALGKSQGLGGHDVHHRVARNTGALVRELISSGRFGALIVFGGDTLMGIARANGWGTLTPLTEVMDGITVSRPEGEPLTIISKSGGFGDDDVLARILGFVKNGCALSGERKGTP